MGRNCLAGRDGDAANAILAVAGYNFRLLLAWLAAVLYVLLAIKQEAIRPIQDGLSAG